MQNLEGICYALLIIQLGGRTEKKIGLYKLYKEQHMEPSLGEYPFIDRMN